MTPTCENIRSWLSRTAEGEAAPDEALAVGRHVQDCTPCRIRLARERRIADMVGGLADPIEVDESFLARVMDELPSHPPRARRRKHRGLKLAGVGIGFVLAGSLLATSLAGVPAGTLATWIPTPGSFDTTRIVAEVGGVFVRAAEVTAAAAIDGASIRPSTPSMAGLVTALALPGLALLGMLGSAVLLTAARLSR